MPPGSELLGETVSDVAGLDADNVAGAVALDRHGGPEGKVQRSSGAAALGRLNLSRKEPPTFGRAARMRVHLRERTC